jgi:hypothetical protein
LLPPGFDYPCSDFDTVQVIVNTLDSAQTPKNRAQLMQRIGRIGECVTTPLAVKAEDEEAARRQLQKDQINWLRANPPWYLRD